MLTPYNMTEKLNILLLSPLSLRQLSSASVINWTLLHCSIPDCMLQGEKGDRKHPFVHLNWERKDLKYSLGVTIVSTCCLCNSFFYSWSQTLDPNIPFLCCHFPSSPHKAGKQDPKGLLLGKMKTLKASVRYFYLLLKTHPSGTIKWSNAKFSLISALSIYCIWTDWTYKEGAQQKIQRSFFHKAKQTKKKAKKNK